MALAIQGINFRNTLGYVTDGADEHAELTGGGTPNYPDATSQGFNVGWETINQNITPENHNTSPDPRIAGDAYMPGTGNDTYRIDLPSTGDWDVELAMGDRNYAMSCSCEAFDTSSSLGVIAGDDNVPSGDFIDATDTIRTSASDWVSNQAKRSLTFTTTIARFEFDDNASGNGDYLVNHLKVYETLSRELKAYRFYEDGTESGSTALDSQDTNITIAPETTFQVRTGMQASGDPPTETAELQYRPTGVGEWISVEDE